MIYLIPLLIVTVITLAGCCLYLTLVCNQLRTVNQGHVERMQWAKATHEPDYCDGDGI